MLRLARRALKLELVAGLGRLLVPFDRFVRQRAVQRVPEHPRVLLFGWYGTETTGDRAILAECVRLVEDAFGSCRFQLASTRPSFTRDTVRLLRLEVEVVSWHLPGEHDLVVIAGGPIMDDPEMLRWWLRLMAARAHDKPCVLLGMGVHPLRRLLPLGRSLAALSQRVALREEGDVPGRVFVDPALYGPVPARTRGSEFRLAVNLRPWPAAFYHGPFRAYAPTWERFLTEILGALGQLAQDGIELVFFPMHDLAPDDDRLLYPVLGERVPNAEFLDQLPSPAEVGELLAGCHALVGMRFHANVLAALAGTPGVGIDYDSGLGKVTRFYRRLGTEPALALAEVTRELVVDRVRAIQADWQSHHERTVGGRDRLRAERPELVRWLAELR